MGSSGSADAEAELVALGIRHHDPTRAGLVDPFGQSGGAQLLEAKRLRFDRGADHEIEMEAILGPARLLGNLLKDELRTGDTFRRCQRAVLIDLAVGLVPERLGPEGELGIGIDAVDGDVDSLQHEIKGTGAPVPDSGPIPVSGYGRRMVTHERPWSAVVASAAARGSEIEELRRLPQDLVDAMASTGVFRLWLPQEYGGGESTLQEGLDAIEEAGYHDGSTGWAVMIANTTALLAASLPAEHAHAIYDDPHAITGGFANPVGTARLVDGGARVDGRWAWGSGSSHCTAIGGGCRVVDASGTPTALPDGGRVAFVFFDLDQVEMLDTWHVAGLKGTASTDYQTSDAFVPEGRWVSLDVRNLVVEGPLYRFSTFGALALGVTMVSLGLGRRAIDELVSYAEKVPQGSSRGLAERPAVQMQIAQAEARVRAGVCFVREVVAEAWDTVASGGRMTDDLKCDLRLAATHATESAASAVDLCYHAAGGAAVYEAAAIQRVFRDMHVATQHAMVAPRVFEPLGRRRFGLETDTRTL